MTHHLITLDSSGDYSYEHYGVMFRSRHVYDTTVSHGPTRLSVWDNLIRPNRDYGKQLGDTLEVGARRGNVVTDYSLRYTVGKWLDPQNEPTDDTVSLLLEPESSVITSNGTNTGTVASGQVYAPGKLADSDTATLSFPGGYSRKITLHFPKWSNGHGHATFTE